MPPNPWTNPVPQGWPILGTLLIFYGFWLFLRAALWPARLQVSLATSEQVPSPTTARWFTVANGLGHLAFGCLITDVGFGIKVAVPSLMLALIIIACLQFGEQRAEMRELRRQLCRGENPRSA